VGAGRGETRGAGKAAEAQAHGEEFPRVLDGSTLTGTILEFHIYTFALEVDGKPILIYKHAVKTIEEIPSSADS